MGLISQLVHAVGLSGTHLLGQPEDGVGPLLVDLGLDTVDEVGALLTGVVRAERPVLGIGLQKELPQEADGVLQDAGLPGGKGVVQEAGHKAHRLGLPLFPHRRLNGAAVEVVQGGGEGFQVGMAGGAPPQHIGQQGVGGGRLLRQGGHQGEGEQVALEFIGMHRRQPDAGHQFPVSHLDHSRAFLSFVIGRRDATGILYYIFPGLTPSKQKKAPCAPKPEILSDFFRYRPRICS